MSRTFLLTVLVLLGTLWGLSVPFTKLAVSTGHDPFGMLFWQFVVGLICLGPLVLLRRSNLVIDRRHALFFLVIAVLGTVVPNASTYITYVHLPASVMALLIAMVPLFSLLVALVIGLEHFNMKRMLGVLVGLMAMGLIVLPEGSLPDPAKAIWVLVGLVAPLCYGVEGNYLALKQPDDTGPVGTLFGGSFMGLVIVTPIMIWRDAYVDLSAGMGVAEWSLMANCVIHVVAYSGYVWLVGRSGAVFASLVGYVVTPAGMVFSILVLGESPSPYIWLALALIMVALTLVRPAKAQTA